MIHLKNAEEIELMYQSAQLVSKTLGEIAKHIQPGITTKKIDAVAEEFIRDNGGIPGFLGLYNFPNTLCVSPNEQVVHGIPNDTPLENGDIISVDCGVLMNNYYGDHAYTFEIGEVKSEVKKLLKITKESLYEGIKACNTSNRIGDIGYAIQTYCEKEGYGVVKELVGHGLGKKMHEDPQVPNYGRRGNGKRIKNGMTLAIEPMINLGTDKVKFHKDGWTVTSRDNSFSAHFEHNVAVINDKPVLLSTFDYVHNVLGIKSSEEDEFRYKENTVSL
ncbi:MAG: type I methionyl aminopeptidase [Flavobacteriales bacterium]|nr:type I methionyl aminopeptidase [Flavobacteriales bacterium]